MTVFVASSWGSFLCIAFGFGAMGSLLLGISTPNLLRVPSMANGLRSVAQVLLPNWEGTDNK